MNRVRGHILASARTMGSCESRSPWPGSATLPCAPAFAGARSPEGSHGFEPLSRSAQQGSESSRRSAQQGFESSWRSAQQGFTLVELLVALAIFSMLAGAGVLLLRGSVDTQRTVAVHLDALGDVQRGLATLESDLAQAVVRISRTQAGTSAPAFFGREAQSGEPLMQFVRGGWANPAGQRHPSIQKVEYWWREGRIERVGYPVVDGAEPPEPSTLFTDVTALALRYRAPDGSWQDVWAPTVPQIMPVAVELTVTRQNEPPFVLRFLVGPSGTPEEAEESGQGSGNDS